MFQISFRIVGLNWQMKDQDLTKLPTSEAKTEVIECDW